MGADPSETKGTIMVQFMSILSRLTGISTPVFGVSWDPPEPEVKIAKELMAYFEDRRYLYCPFEQEVSNYVTQSLDETRDRLTALLVRAGRNSPLGEGIVAMRSAAREFMSKVDGGGRNPSLGFELILALGELRAACGLHIARIAVAYAIDVSDDLAQIFPPLKTSEDSSVPTAVA